MVIDRLQLFIFLAVTIGGTIGILIDAPHIFEFIDQEARIAEFIDQEPRIAEFIDQEASIAEFIDQEARIAEFIDQEARIAKIMGSNTGSSFYPS